MAITSDNRLIDFSTPYYRRDTGAGNLGRTSAIPNLGYEHRFHTPKWPWEAIGTIPITGNPSIFQVAEDHTQQQPGVTQIV
jgi:hypothetical protein